jgi:transposase
VDFAIDSSGFSTCRYKRWFDVKYGNTEDWHDWIKIHLICGVKTNIVTGIEISSRYANDSPYFIPLLTATAENFRIIEVSADREYVSLDNREAVLAVGGEPYIPFKSNSIESKESKTWNRLRHFYLFHQEEFNQHYHKRSNVETTFSMIKANFGEKLKSKTETAQVNEALCKVLCHNVCVVLQSIYELGIEAEFVDRS